MAMPNPPFTDAYLAAQRRLRALIAKVLASLWRSLPTYDKPDTDRLIKQIVPIVLGGQIQTVAMTDAYIAHLMGRPPIGLDPANFIGAAVRNGTPPEEVYFRAAREVWRELANHRPWQEAVDAGEARLISAAMTNIQRTHLETVYEIGNLDKGIEWWERVTQPGACNLCLMASTQRYHKRDVNLKAIHNHCNCTVVAHRDAFDPGRIINPELLDALKDSGKAEELKLSQQASRARKAGNTQQADQIAAKLKEHRATMRAGNFVGLAVHEHGELGPYLAHESDHFTGPEDIQHAA